MQLHNIKLTAMAEPLVFPLGCCFNMDPVLGSDEQQIQIFSTLLETASCAIKSYVSINSVVLD